MNHISGSAIQIESELPSDKVSGSVVTLLKLLDFDNNTVIENQSMSFDTVNTSVAFMVWQSTANTHTAGRYTYLTKVVNGAYTNISKGYFNLEDQP